MANAPQQERDHHNQQYVDSHDLSFEEVCRDAQRAAVETLHIGRATLEQVHQQGEQLDRVESIADETEYRLDKAGRILRGMTWSGWLANKFTKDVGPPPPVTTDRSMSISPPLVYENVPETCRAAAQAIQNYHANVKVLETCETEEQRGTLLLICESMYTSAMTQLDILEKRNAPIEAYLAEFKSHLTILHEKEQSFARTMGQPKASVESNRAELLGGSHSASSTTNAHLQLQEDHLDMISKSLGEIGMISHTLASAIAQQTQAIDTLDEKAESITEKSKMVTRRADRIIQKKSWTPVKPTFACHVSIRHVASGRYLSVHEGNLVLELSCHTTTNVFSLWKRQGEVFGLKNKESGRWLGQTLLGGIGCSAYDFGRREEWESDSDWGNSRLLCTSVKWGAGGYILVNPQNFSVRLGGYGAEERNMADLWCITDLEKQEEP